MGITRVHRAPLLSLLRQYAPIDAEDAACRDRFVAFVERHRDCFERTLAVGHVTGSAWLIDHRGERVVLTHHRKLDRWLQPGGHADGDSDPAAVALREAREETGLEDLALVSAEIFDLDIHPIPARGSETAHEHFDVRFVVRATGRAEFVVSEESHALAWVRLDQLENYTHERSILRMREKWLRRPSKLSVR